MKYPPFILLAAFASPIYAQGISAEGTSQDGVTAEGDTYNGTGTVQDSHADGDIKVIDVLESGAEVKEKEEKPDKEDRAKKVK